MGHVQNNEKKTHCRHERALIEDGVRVAMSFIVTWHTDKDRQDEVAGSRLIPQSISGTFYSHLLFVIFFCAFLCGNLLFCYCSRGSSSLAAMSNACRMAIAHGFERKLKNVRLLKLCHCKI